MKKLQLLTSLFTILIVFQAGAQPPVWEPVSNLEHTMMIIARLELTDGGFAQNPDDMVGAFVNGECRGVASPLPGTEGLLFLSVGSNQTSGEVITFMAYLADTDQVVDLAETLPYEANGSVGSIGDEFIFTVDGEEPPAEFTLSVTIEGLGSVAVNGHLYSEAVTVAEGTSLNLFAQAEAGWQFESWSGDLEGNNPEAEILMNADKHITAHFAEIPPEEYFLTINTQGAGSVTVDGNHYSEALIVEAGTLLTLSALPASGWVFSMWTGDVSSLPDPSQSTVEYTMPADDVALTAVFVEVAGPPNWEPVSNLEHTMMIIARLELIDGTFAQNPADMVGAFVNGKCRGVASPLPGTEGLLFLSVGSNQSSGEVITFMAYLADTDQVVHLAETLPYEANGSVGSIGDEFIFTIDGEEPGVPHQNHLKDITIAHGESVCFAALQTIITGGDGPFIVQSGAVVDLIAGENIIMKPGTHIQNGSLLHAYIATDGVFCGDAGVHFLASETEAANDDKSHHETAENISNTDAGAFFSVYPNPTHDEFVVELFHQQEGLAATVEVYGIRGELVKRRRVHGEQQSAFSLTGQQAGVYLVRVVQGDQVGVERLIRR